MLKGIIFTLTTICFIVIAGRFLKKHLSVEKQIVLAVVVTIISVIALITQDISILNIHTRLTHLNDATAPIYIVTYIGGVVFSIDLAGEYFKKKRLKRYSQLHKRYGNIAMIAFIILGVVADFIFR